VFAPNKLGVGFVVGAVLDPNIPPGAVLPVVAAPAVLLDPNPVEGAALGVEAVLPNNEFV
jgi:hypothetical protein